MACGRSYTSFCWIFKESRAVSGGGQIYDQYGGTSQDKLYRDIEWKFRKNNKTNDTAGCYQAVKPKIFAGDEWVQSTKNSILGNTRMFHEKLRPYQLITELGKTWQKKVWKGVHTFVLIIFEVKAKAKKDKNCEKMLPDSRRDETPRL